MNDTIQKQLGNILWSIADQLRGAMDADDFRDYMLSFLFLRYLSDNYETAAKKELGNRRANSPLPSRYTACSEFPSPAQLGNSQGMLDSSNLRALTKKWQASHRSATRYAASFAVTALEATTDESLVIREDGGASS